LLEIHKIERCEAMRKNILSFYIQPKICLLIAGYNRVLGTVAVIHPAN